MLYCNLLKTKMPDGIIGFVNKKILSEKTMLEFGHKLGNLLSGGETIELIGDVGAGKTTLVKGLARGLSVDDTVQSPSFTISRIYDGRGGLVLAHYDFYRLQDAGIMRRELAERLLDKRNVVVVEWSENVGDILPIDRLSIRIKLLDEKTRILQISSSGEKSAKLLGSLEQ